MGHLVSGNQLARKDPKMQIISQKLLHRAYIFFILSLCLSLSSNLRKSLSKMHLIYSEGHGNKGFCSVAIYTLGQVSKFQSLWDFLFFYSGGGHQLYNSEWKLLMSKAAETVSPCVLCCVEIDFSYLLSWKSFLLSEKNMNALMGTVGWHIWDENYYEQSS